MRGKEESQEYEQYGCDDADAAEARPGHDALVVGGDPVLERIVSDDARDVTAMLATMSVLLAGATMVVIRSRGFVIVSAVVLVLGLINLVRLAPYY